MGQSNRPMSKTQIGWEPYMFGNGNTASSYDPYSQSVNFGPPTQQQYMDQRQVKNTRCGLGAGEAEKLDKVTRSRNALIIALIFFVAFGLACFIAVLVIAFPASIATTTTTTTTSTSTTTEAPIDSTTIQVNSTLTAQTFNADDMGTGSASFNILNATFCSERIIPAVMTIVTVNTCDLQELSAGTTGGVLGRVNLNVALNGETAAARLVNVQTNVVAAATLASTWTSTDAEITTLS